MLACVIGNAAIQIKKDNISSEDQGKRDSTIMHLNDSLSKFSSAVSAKFDSLGYKFEKNTLKLLAKNDSTAADLTSKLGSSNLTAIGMPGLGLSQDDIGPQIKVNHKSDTTDFEIITENNGNGNARNIVATLVIIPANGILHRLRSYPMRFEEDFVAPKRFFTLLPSTWPFPKVDTIYFYLRLDYSPDLPNHKRFHNEKLYLWTSNNIRGEVTQTERISNFLKENYGIRY